MNINQVKSFEVVKYWLAVENYTLQLTPVTKIGKEMSQQHCQCKNNLLALPFRWALSIKIAFGVFCHQDC